MLGEETSLTLMLRDHARGRTDALAGVVDLAYDDLRRLARHCLRGRPPQTLDSRSLVHEAYLKMVRARRPEWRDGGHFRASFGQAMRHVLVDAARRRLTARRGGGQAAATLDEESATEDRRAEELLAVDQAMGSLRALDERLSRVVECRFFAGMTEEETAEHLKVSARTVHRDWLRARGWLRLRLGPQGAAGRSAR